MDGRHHGDAGDAEMRERMYRRRPDGIFRERECPRELSAEANRATVAGYGHGECQTGYCGPKGTPFVERSSMHFPRPIAQEGEVVFCLHR